MLSEISRKTLFIQFQLEPNASDSKMKKISIILGISFKEVQKFFQNQRKFSKMRRAKRSEIQRTEALKVQKAKEIGQRQKSSLESSRASSGYSSLGTQKTLDISNMTEQFKFLESEEFEDPAIVAAVKTSTPQPSIRDRIKYRQEVKAFKNLNNLSCIRPSTPIRNMKKIAEENLIIRKKNRKTLF